MSYDEIVAGLVVGSCPKSSADVRELKQATGVTAALSLQTDADLQWLGLQWAQMAGWYAEAGIRAFRAPVRDMDTQDLREKLPDCARLLDNLLSAGHTVYLHCTAGAGRSPSLAIAWLVWRQGKSLEEAYAWVMQRRACSPDLEAIRAALREYPAL